jgi:hypothetical protein
MKQYVLSFISFLLFFLAILLGIKGHYVLTNRYQIKDVEEFGIAGR